jgi:hypothetical protein
MLESEWRERYILEMMKTAHLERKDAEACANATDYDEAAMMLELRLIVAHQKYDTLAKYAELLADTVLADGDPEGRRGFAEKVKVVLRELENTAVNLHR